MKDKNIPKKAYTIEEFCSAYRICRTTYYVLRKDGRAPIAHKIDRKWLISIEDANKWFQELKDGK